TPATRFEVKDQDRLTDRITGSQARFGTANVLPYYVYLAITQCLLGESLRQLRPQLHAEPPARAQCSSYVDAVFACLVPGPPPGDGGNGLPADTFAFPAYASSRLNCPGGHVIR